MKTKKSLFVSSLFMLFSSYLFAQTTENIRKIEERTKSYFNLNRENFYLHFNKSVYINSESIYFKGYVFDKNNDNLNVETTNIHVDFYTSNGTKLESKLLYSSNGEFEGFFDLKNDLPSDTYYFQVHTNWINNFSEDESGLFSVKIINPNTGEINYTDDSPILSLNPEGGSFLTEVSNTIGVSILDCQNNGLEISDGIVTNEKGEEITTFQTNNLGYGKFQITNTTNQNYTVKFVLKGKTISKTLPKPNDNGTTLKVIDYMNDSKTFVTIESNKKYKNLDKEHYLTISQNNKVATIPFNFFNLKKEITLLDSLLFPGVNVLRVLDSDLKQVNERVIYNYHKKSFNSNWNVLKKTNDSIKIATSFYNNAKISVSILPAESVTTNATNTISNSFFINSYIQNKIPNGNTYFTEVNRKKKYELDLFMLNQKSKYQWENFEKIPTEKYAFTKGLTLKGRINETLDDKTKYQVQMFAFAAGINVNTTINEKNEFYFKNFIASDSLQINFSLIKNGSKYKELVYFPQLISDEKPFTKPFQGIKTICTTIPNTPENNKNNLEIPNFKEAVKLKEVVIETKIIPNDTKRRADYGNFNLKAKKITTDIYNSYRYILPYLQSQGFDAGVINGTVFVQGRTRTSFTKTNIPAIFLDGVQLYDFDILNFFSLEQVDEILINKYASGVQSQGFGVIKIYTKQDFKTKTTFKSKSKPFIIKNGFAYEKPFVIPDYASLQSEGFKKYGTIGWTPIANYENKAVVIELPTLQQKEIILQIEGIDESGNFISEIKKITMLTSPKKSIQIY